MTIQERLDFIHRTSWMKSRPGLERITELMHLLGDPQKNLRFIHVAGTNGKGSTTAMLSSVLRKAGYRTGMYTSPHLWRVHERFCINGEDISDEELCAVAEEVRPCADQMEDQPTEFEIITAIAFKYFKDKGCDLVVLEVGLGGRFDATNVIEQPLLSIITGISLDHVAILGDTIEKIAYEKAGIIKTGCPILFGGGHSHAARGVIEQESRHREAPYYEVDQIGRAHV